LETVLNWNLPEILRDKGPQSSESLASITASSAPHLLRLLRSLKTEGFFAQRSDGKWGNNANSSHLIAFRPLVHFVAKLTAPTWMKLADAVQTGNPQFSNVFNGLDFWQYFQKNPDEAKNFGEALITLGNIDAPALINKFPWEKI